MASACPRLPIQTITTGVALAQNDQGAQYIFAFAAAGNFDPQRLRLTLKVNGKTMQDSNTDQLIFGVPALIEFISQTITLEPGDVIATGTPAGVGFARKPPVFLKPGDQMEVMIEGVDGVGNPVVSEQD